MRNAVFDGFETASFKRGIFITKLVIKDFQSDAYDFGVNSSICNYDKTADASVRFIYVSAKVTYGRQGKDSVPS